MDPFEHPLTATEKMLRLVGEDNWADRIQSHIELWRTEKNPSIHLSVYGGMGSFTDVVLCKANQHQVTHEQEPWVNSLFEWLQSICFYLARNPNKDVSVAELVKNVGRLDAPFSTIGSPRRATSFTSSRARPTCR